MLKPADGVSMPPQHNLWLFLACIGACCLAAGCRGKTDTSARGLEGVRAALSTAGLVPSSTELPTITVPGDAVVRVVPDEVVLTVGVETADGDLHVAKSQNDAAVKKAVTVARQNGIEAKNIQTDYIQMYPTDYPTHRYNVRQTLIVTLKDIPKFDGLLTALLDAGINNVHGVEFRTSELRKHRDTARALAIRAAREKAKAMAAELGKDIGDPRNIQEEQSDWRSSYWTWWGWYGRSGGQMQNVAQNAVQGSPEPTSEGLAPGQITVTARVKVAFELR